MYIYNYYKIYKIGSHYSEDQSKVYEFHYDQIAASVDTSELNGDIGMVTKVWR